jgi:hypothetical protein
MVCLIASLLVAAVFGLLAFMGWVDAIAEPPDFRHWT